MAIGVYKKGTLQSGIKPLFTKGNLVELQGFTNTENAIAEAIDFEIQALKKSLIKNKHASASGSQRSNTILQAIGSDLEFKHEGSNTYGIGGVYIIEFGNGGDVGKYIDQGTKPSKHKHPSKKMVDSVASWISSINSLSNIANGNKGKRYLAYAIATNILKKGIIKRFGYKGSKWYTDIAGANNEKLEKYLTDKISIALGKDVEVSVTKQAKDMLNGSNNNGVS